MSTAAGLKDVRASQFCAVFVSSGYKPKGGIGKFSVPSNFRYMVPFHTFMRNCFVLLYLLLLIAILTGLRYDDGTV